MNYPFYYEVKIEYPPPLMQGQTRLLSIQCPHLSLRHSNSIDSSMSSSCYIELSGVMVYAGSEAENSKALLERQAAEIAQMQEQMWQLTTEKEQQQMKGIASAEKRFFRSHSRPEVRVYVLTRVHSISEQMLVQYCILIYKCDGIAKYWKIHHFVGSVHLLIIASPHSMPDNYNYSIVFYVILLIDIHVVDIYAHLKC